MKFGKAQILIAKISRNIDGNNLALIFQFRPVSGLIIGEDRFQLSNGNFPQFFPKDLNFRDLQR